MHPSQLPREIIDRAVKLRGRLRVFEDIVPSKSALVVIDMQNAFCRPGSSGEVPTAREIVPNINRLADVMRKAGGTVVWVQSTINQTSEWPVFLESIVSPDLAKRFVDDWRTGSDGQKLWPAMDARDFDVFVEKKRFSAFLPSSCPLGDILIQRKIETAIIVGTLTNVCCESSARDAAMSDFKTIMISDANACRSDADHLASLSTFFQAFGDVCSTVELIDLLGENSAEATGRRG